MSELKRCPFCNKKLKRIKGGYEHPFEQCVLSSFIIAKAEINQWNTRKTMERILERLEKMLKLYETHAVLLSDSEKAFMKAIEIVKEEGGIRNE